MAPAVKLLAPVAHFAPDQDLSAHAVAAAELPRVVAAAAAVLALLHVRRAAPAVVLVSPHVQPVVKLVRAVFAAVAVPAFAPLAPRAAAQERGPERELQTTAAPLDPDLAPDARL